MNAPKRLRLLKCAFKNDIKSITAHLNKKIIFFTYFISFLLVDPDQPFLKSVDDVLLK